MTAYFINCTASDISIKFSDEIFTITPTTDRKLKELFWSLKQEMVDMTSVWLPNNGEVNVVTMSEPIISGVLFKKFIQDQKYERITIHLVDEAFLRAIKGYELPPRCFFFTPYIGPDPTRCFRLDGEIIWSAELIGLK